MPGIKGTMEEFKAGTLHSGSKHGPKVKSRKQAIAIGLSEERKAHKKNNSDRHAKLDADGCVAVSHHDVSGVHRMMKGMPTKNMKGMMKDGSY